MIGDEVRTFSCNFQTTRNLGRTWGSRHSADTHQAKEGTHVSCNNQGIWCELRHRHCPCGAAPVWSYQRRRAASYLPCGSPAALRGGTSANPCDSPLVRKISFAPSPKNERVYRRWTGISNSDLIQVKPTIAPHEEWRRRARADHRHHARPVTPKN